MLRLKKMLHRTLYFFNIASLRTLQLRFFKDGRYIFTVMQDPRSFMIVPICNRTAYLVSHPSVAIICLFWRIMLNLGSVKMRTSSFCVRPSRPTRTYSRVRCSGMHSNYMFCLIDCTTSFSRRQEVVLEKQNRRKKSIFSCLLCLLHV